ncbi:MAG: hypothetical protein CSB55_01665 [Candidatus Cloacimonadota bacterium]|nr:MAG: hypothetical protein CSB55_01665 [Candidatus Cloacimonadota bacterium]
MKKLFFIVLLTGGMLFASVSDEYLFGKRMFDDKLYDEAIHEFKMIYTKYPTSPYAEQALFYSGEAYRMKKEYKKAEEIYRMLRDGYPDSLLKDKALYYLALSSFKQGKAEEAAKLYASLFKLFPQSDITKTALTDFINACYKAENFEEVIVTGRELKRNYPENEQLPDVLFSTAKAFYKLNRPQEAEKALQTVIKEFPDYDARWKALELSLDQIEKNQGLAKATEKLSEELKQNPPRFYDEKFREKLLLYLIAQEKYAEVSEQINILINRYDNSQNAPFYIKTRSDIRLKLAHYGKIIDSFKKELKYVKKSKYFNDYRINFAKACYFSKKYRSAEEALDEFDATDLSNSLNYEKDLLAAKIQEKTGHLRNAVIAYKKILEKYPGICNREYILNQTGDIFYFKFNQPASALQYYRQAMTSQKENEAAAASFKAALCLEKTEKTEEALDYLYQINTENITDKTLLKKIEQKKTYLLSYKYKNYKSALEKLIEATEKFIRDNDKEKFNSALTEITVKDLKDYKAGLRMNENIESNRAYYNNALLYLKLADKARLEGNIALQEEYLKNSDEMKNKIEKNPELLLETEIEKSLVIDGYEINENTAKKLENFISSYGNKESANRYRYLSGKYYEKTNPEKTALLFEALTPEKIGENDYKASKLKLAEYYFQKDKFDLAVANYELAGNLTGISNPGAFYHQALSLAEIGKTEESIKRLNFLVNNAESFDNFNKAVIKLAEFYENKGDLTASAELYQKISDDEQNDDYCRKISDLFNKINQPEKAKISLMRIENKTNSDMEKLADLQFITGDGIMSEYTLEELIKKENDLKKRLLYFQKIGHIAFMRGDYEKSSKKYQKIIKDFKSKIKPEKYKNLNLKMIAEESIISSLKTGNRPQADRYKKLFKKILKKDKIAENKISLEQGIYYINVNPEKAIGYFKKLMKKEETPPEIKTDAYFWNGVAKLKIKDTEEAKKNFKYVLKNGNQEQKNQANLKLGSIYFSAEKYKEALAFYYSVIENDETGNLAKDAARNFAVVCKTIEEWEKAIEAYEIILEKFGNSQLEGETVFNIAYCHFRNKKYKNAVKMFEEALPLLKDDEMKAESQYWIGESYFGKEEYEKAVTAYIKVGYNYSKYPHWRGVAEIRAGEAYLKQGKPDKARYIWQRVISVFGKNSQWGKQAQAHLDLLPI